MSLVLKFREGGRCSTLVAVPAIFWRSLARTQVVSACERALQWPVALAIFGHMLKEVSGVKNFSCASVKIPISRMVWNS